MFNLSTNICALLCLNSHFIQNNSELKVKWINPYSAGIDFSRQILMTEVDPRAVKIKTLLIVVDP